MLKNRRWKDLLWGSLLCLLTLSVFYSVNSLEASATYVLTDSDSIVTLDGSAEAWVLQQKLVSVTDANSSNPDIHLKSGRMVVIDYHGTTLRTISQQETVSQLLLRLQVFPGAQDMVGVDGSGDVIRITISTTLRCYISQTITLQQEEPYPTEYQTLYDQPEGTEIILREAQEDQRENVYEVVYEGGQVVSRRLYSSQILPGCGAIVGVGTLVSQAPAGDSIDSVIPDDEGNGGYLIMSSGVSLRYTSSMKVTATAYTSGYGGVGTITATGTTVSVGSIAVDRSVIALGTDLLVSTSRGLYAGTAEDTGVRGRAVDLYMNSYEQCMSFGRRSGTVYLLA